MKVYVVIGYKAAYENFDGRFSGSASCLGVYWSRELAEQFVEDSKGGWNFDNVEVEEMEVREEEPYQGCGGECCKDAMPVEG